LPFIMRAMFLRQRVVWSAAVPILGLFENSHKRMAQN
jgi:hypothetical protein